MANNDAVVGVFSNLGWQDVAPWANSLSKSGFTGSKVAIIHNAKKDVIDKLIELDFTVMGFNRTNDGDFFYHDSQSLMVNRFFHIWMFLNGSKSSLRNIIVTDVKDVIFQSDPSEIFDTSPMINYYDQPIITAGEGITYENEPWSKNNMINSFGPVIYETMKHREIRCAGVIAGEANKVLDLCLNIYLVCCGLRQNVSGGGGPDQAAYNILLSQDIMKNNEALHSQDMPWALQCGTTRAAVEAGSGEIGFQYKLGNIENIDDIPFLFSKDPILKDGKLVTPYREIPYPIVHQYNRVPAWNKLRDQYV